MRALSLSRLAYDLESVVRAMLAAALLAFISFHNLFAGTVIGFLVSAALLVSVVLPSPRPSKPRGIYDRATRGVRIYLATPRLRGLLAINLAVASAGALAIVNTMVMCGPSTASTTRPRRWCSRPRDRLVSKVGPLEPAAELGAYRGAMR